MSAGTIEERVTRLEQLVERMLREQSPVPGPDRDNWQRTFGMFTDDPIMKEIIEAGRHIREEDRRQSGP